jgi:para-nitrobenzyl esterase
VLAEVRTVSGTVRGRWDDWVATFRGVPFGAPPVGRDRFAAPRRVTPWDGVRDAGRFGPPPPQPDVRAGDAEWLTVAVWTPDLGRVGLPVVVWISGGAYLKCDTASPHLTGSHWPQPGRSW